MYDERDKLARGKKVRACSRRFVTTLSAIFFVGYVAASVLNIPVLSLCFSVAGTVLSALSFALNIWSLKDYFLRERSGVAGQKKLTKIYLDITSNISFLAGGVAPTLPLESSIIPFVSNAFFILGCVIMAANIVQTMISEPELKERIKSRNPKWCDSWDLIAKNTNKLTCLTYIGISVIILTV